MAADAQRCFGI